MTAALPEGSGNLIGDTERDAMGGVVDYDGADLAATEPGDAPVNWFSADRAHRVAAGQLRQRTRFGVLIES